MYLYVAILHSTKRLIELNHDHCLVNKYNQSFATKRGPVYT